MAPLTTLKRWLERLDREWHRSFATFLWREFLDDNCFETAGWLAFTTIFALVPLTAAVFGIVSLFPVYETWLDELTRFIFANFVPSAAGNIAGYLRQFGESARGLSMIGAGVVLVTALMTMRSIEDAFNRIWRVETPRRAMARFLIYWAALTIGPLLAVASLAVSYYIFSLPLIATTAEEFGVAHVALRLTPVLIELAAFTAAYRFIPNRVVALRFAVAGGVLATVLFEAAKYAMAFYISRASFQLIYGALAVIPIFMFWIYISWAIILLGASLAASLASFRYQPVALRLPAGYELFALLRLLGRFAISRRTGQSLSTDAIQTLEPCLTDDLLQRMIVDLARIGVIECSERGTWLLARDLDTLTLGELYEAGSFRVPINEAWLPCRDDALGQMAHDALDELRLPLRQALKRSVGSLIHTLEKPAT